MYLSAPSMSLALSLLNSTNPTMGRYSLTRELQIKHTRVIIIIIKHELNLEEREVNLSLISCCSAFLTTLRTKGFPSYITLTPLTKPIDERAETSFINHYLSSVSTNSQIKLNWARVLVICNCHLSSNKYQNISHY